MKYIKAYEEINSNESIKFSFSLDDNGGIDDISAYSSHNQNICEIILNYLLDNQKIIMGEKTEGEIEIDENDIYLDYKYCTVVGEDWDDDVWEDVEEHIYDDQIQTILAANKYNL